MASECPTTNADPVRTGGVHHCPRRCCSYLRARSVLAHKPSFGYRRAFSHSASCSRRPRCARGGKAIGKLPFEERRHEDLYLIARSEAPFGEAATGYAEELADAGRGLASTDPLPSPGRVLETLRSIPSPIPGLRDERLVRLAAAHQQVAVSPRLELYPRSLDALRALKLAQSSFAGITRITAEELRTRVRDRYPESQPLPNPPDLHKFVEQAGLGLAPDHSGNVYVAPTISGLASSSSLHRFQTLVTPGAASYLPPIERPREIEEALEFERRLKAAYRAPSYLVLATEPKLKYLEMALQESGQALSDAGVPLRT